MTDLARNVRRRRAERRLTQKQAAEAAGMSLSTWQALERETVDPSRFRPLTLAAAAEALDVPVATVFEWAGQPWPAAAESRDAAPEIPDTLEGQLEELDRLLRALAEVSELDYLLVYGQAIEMADHLLARSRPDRSP